MGNKKNIIVGAANVYLGPSLSVPQVNATNAEIATAISAWKGSAPTGSTRFVPAEPDWRNVGYTQDGVEIATDPSWGEVEVDQLLDSAKIFKDGMGLSINTTFAEATLENLLVAWGQAGSFLTNTSTVQEVEIDGGGLGDAPLERGLIAVGNAPEGTTSNQYGERTYFAYRVLSVDASTHSLARADATTVPVSFRALPADNGKYGSVRDRVLS